MSVKFVRRVGMLHGQTLTTHLHQAVLAREMEVLCPLCSHELVCVLCWLLAHRSVPDQDDLLTPATRLLEKRREMIEVEAELVEHTKRYTEEMERWVGWCARVRAHRQEGGAVGGRVPGRVYG
jgi:hypothetical protein